MTLARMTGAVLTLACGAALWAPPASAEDRRTTTIGVRNGASEFSFSLSRTQVKPGPAIIQYHNTGEDPHDLRVQRKGSPTLLATGLTLPGLFETLPLTKLKADSRYLLWCSLDGHRPAGMEATVRVRKRS